MQTISRNAKLFLLLTLNISFTWIHWNSELNVQSYFLYCCKKNGTYNYTNVQNFKINIYILLRLSPNGVGRDYGPPFAILEFNNVNIIKFCICNKTNLRLDITSTGIYSYFIVQNTQYKNRNDEEGCFWVYILKYVCKDGCFFDSSEV